MFLEFSGSGEEFEKLFQNYKTIKEFTPSYEVKNPEVMRFRALDSASLEGKVMAKTSCP